MACSPTGSSVHGILQARILELPFPPPGYLPNPETEPRSPALQADSLSAELPGKPTCVTNHWEIISQCMCIKSTYTP